MHETQETYRALGDVADTNPETLAANTPRSARFRYIDLSAVEAGFIGWGAVSETTFGSAPSRARRIVKASDVLFGTVRPNLKSHGFIGPGEQGPLVASTGFSVVRARDGVSHPSYLFHSLMSSRVTAQAVRDAIGSSYPAVNDSDVRRFQIFLPSYREQQKIAQILDTLDTAIRETEAIIAKLKAVKQGLLHDLLTRGIDANGELRPPQAEAPHLYKESPVGWIPKEWDVVLLDDVAVRGSGHTPSKSIPSYWNGGIKWVSLADSHRLDNIYIDETDKELSALGLANSSAVLHAAGTVVLSRDAGVGKSAVLARDMAVSQHFMAWRCGDRLNNLFLYFYLQREKPKFEAIALGSTVKTIGLPFFKSYRVAIPPRAEQDHAVESLMSAERNLSQHLAEAVKLRDLKLGLMDDLLTGRVRVTPLLQEPQPA